MSSRIVIAPGAALPELAADTAMGDAGASEPRPRAGFGERKEGSQPYLVRERIASKPSLLGGEQMLPPDAEPRRRARSPQRDARSRSPPRRDGRSRSPPRRNARSRSPPRRDARSRSPPRRNARDGHGAGPSRPASRVSPGTRAPGGDLRDTLRASGRGADLRSQIGKARRTGGGRDEPAKGLHSLAGRRGAQQAAERGAGGYDQSRADGVWKHDLYHQGR